MFINEARSKKPDTKFENPSMGFYCYTEPSSYLFRWSRFFQALVSQSGTWLLTNKFHTRECGIYKCEGGCNIVGVGDLVLGKHYCYFDTGMGKQHKTDNAPKMAQLVTELVLKFDPMNPFESLLVTASEHVKCDKEELQKAIRSASVGGPFGGDPLSDFFDWNPFSPPPEDKEYFEWAEKNISWIS